MSSLLILDQDQTVVLVVIVIGVIFNNRRLTALFAITSSVLASAQLLFGPRVNTLSATEVLQKLEENIRY